MVDYRKTLASSQSVYGTPVDNGEGGSYTDAGDTGAMNSVRYTTPSGLPYGCSSCSSVRSLHRYRTDNNSSNAAGVADANGNEVQLNMQ